MRSVAKGLSLNLFNLQVWAESVLCSCVSSFATSATVYKKFQDCPCNSLSIFSCGRHSLEELRWTSLCAFAAMGKACSRATMMPFCRAIRSRFSGPFAVRILNLPTVLVSPQCWGKLPCVTGTQKRRTAHVATSPVMPDCEAKLTVFAFCFSSSLKGGLCLKTLPECHVGHQPLASRIVGPQNFSCAVPHYASAHCLQGGSQ